MRLIPRLPKGLDPFLPLLVLTIVIASLLPARGAAVGLFEGLTSAAVISPPRAESPHCHMPIRW